MDPFDQPSPPRHPASASRKEEASSAHIERDNAQPSLLELVRKEMREQLPAAQCGSQASSAAKVAGGHTLAGSPTTGNAGGSRRREKRGSQKQSSQSSESNLALVASASSAGAAAQPGEHNKAPMDPNFTPVPDEDIRAVRKTSVIPGYDEPAAGARVSTQFEPNGAPSAITSLGSNSAKQGVEKKASKVLGFMPLPGEVLSADGKQFIIPHHDAPAARALLPTHLQATSLSSPESFTASSYAYSAPQSPSSTGSMALEPTSHARPRHTPVIEAARRFQGLTMGASGEHSSPATQTAADSGSSASATGLGITTSPDEPLDLQTFLRSPDLNSGHTDTGSRLRSPSYGDDFTLSPSIYGSEASSAQRQIRTTPLAHQRAFTKQQTPTLLSRQSTFDGEAVPGSSSGLAAPTPVTAAMEEIRTGFPRPGYDAQGNPVSHFSDDSSDEDVVSPTSLRPPPLKSKASMKNLFKKKTKEQQLNEEYRKKLYGPENMTKEQLAREEEARKARHSQTLLPTFQHSTLHLPLPASPLTRSSSLRGTRDSRDRLTPRNPKSTYRESWLHFAPPSTSGYLRRHASARRHGARRSWASARIDASIAEDQEYLITDTQQNHNDYSNVATSDTPIHDTMMMHRTPYLRTDQSALASTSILQHNFSDDLVKRSTSPGKKRPHPLRLSPTITASTVPAIPSSVYGSDTRPSSRRTLRFFPSTSSTRLPSPTLPVGTPEKAAKKLSQNPLGPVQKKGVMSRAWAKLAKNSSSSADAAEAGPSDSITALPPQPAYTRASEETQHHLGRNPTQPDTHPAGCRSPQPDRQPARPSSSPNPPIQQPSPAPAAPAAEPPTTIIRTHSLRYLDDAAPPTPPSHENTTGLLTVSTRLPLPTREQTFVVRSPSPRRAEVVDGGGSTVRSSRAAVFRAGAAAAAAAASAGRGAGMGVHPADRPDPFSVVPDPNGSPDADAVRDAVNVALRRLMPGVQRAVTRLAIRILRDQGYGV